MRIRINENLHQENKQHFDQFLLIEKNRRYLDGSYMMFYVESKDRSTYVMEESLEVL